MSHDWPLKCYRAPELRVGTVSSKCSQEFGQPLSLYDKAVYLRSLVRVARNIYPDVSPLRLAKKTAIFCSNGLRYRIELEHLRSVFACDELSGVLQHFPAILEKSFHPYVSIDWPIDRRFREVETHFTNVKHSFGEKAVEIYKADGYCLFEFTASDDEKYTVELCPGYQCEGSMGLRLCDSEKREVYALSFHLSDQNANACYISGLQGPNDRIPDRQRTIVTITRSLHGLRPKSLMVEAVYMVAGAMGIQKIYGISNSGHIVQSDLYSDKKRSLVEFDYNELWAEYQATSEVDRFFTLPLTPVRKNIQSLKSKKRSLYRKRYAWLTEQSEAVRLSMNALLVDERQTHPPVDKFDEAA